jgi:hypothetical protein
MPEWVKTLLDHWLVGANLTSGRLFRRVKKNGKAWGEGLTEKAVWHVVRVYARKAGIERLGPHDRALPRLQAAHSIRRKRPDRHRARDLIQSVRVQLAGEPLAIRKRHGITEKISLSFLRA